ncbi:MAG: glycerol-3-phosphate 1-O-acyltransferase PlsY [Proteobacteria bacterium]|nr:glycerol-3-phosphate 1-O-acyltransferase PlsY [Pseudomonadota bacterium]
MDIVIDIFIVICSYLLGSVPTGYLIGKYFFKVDIKQLGSGNIGATNVLRNLGKKMGVLTLVGDALKGVIPVVFALLYKPYPLNQTLVFYCALTAFLGHLFPIYLRFRGGKGVATALGIYMILFPLQVIYALIIFFLVVLKTRYVSLGSILSALSMPLFVSFSAKDTYQITLSVIISALVIYKHKDNIHRLLEGRENKIKF